MFDLERTAENLACFKAPPGDWFPRLRLVAMVECGTLAAADAAADSIGAGERELAERMLSSMGEGMLVLADRDFPSLDPCRKIAATGAHFAIRVAPDYRLEPTDTAAGLRRRRRLSACSRRGDPIDEERRCDVDDFIDVSAVAGAVESASSRSVYRQ